MDYPTTCTLAYDNLLRVFRALPKEERQGEVQTLWVALQRDVPQLGCAWPKKVPSSRKRSLQEFAEDSAQENPMVGIKNMCGECDDCLSEAAGTTTNTKEIITAEKEGHGDFCPCTTCCDNYKPTERLMVINVNKHGLPLGPAYELKECWEDGTEVKD